MKVCVQSPIQAMSIQRIVAALAHYKPASVEVVDDPLKADLVVHTVVGVQNFAPTPIHDLVFAEQARGQRFAIVQCCVATTEQPRPDFWVPLWEQAAVVWSYLDLRAFAGRVDLPVYEAPLGVDGATFAPRPLRGRDVLMVTTGYVAESEGVREVAEACKRVGGIHVHVGPDFKLGPQTVSMHGLSDEAMAHLYSRTRFVAGLRRGEGFELPAAEGLVCGARPILFDAPHYTRWFGDLEAAFVPEADEATVASAIEQVFHTYTPVSPALVAKAAARFDWRTLVEGFWERALQDRAVAA